MELLNTVAEAGQVSLEVISQVILSPFCKLGEVNVLLLVPALTPLTFH
jgi:hypothetical protein